MIVTHLRTALLATGLAFVLTACQGVPADFKPDPKLKTESVGALKARVARACVISQRAKSSATTGVLETGCGCYAGKMFSAMSKDEVSFYRANGYFADSARPKGQAALAACKLEA